MKKIENNTNFVELSSDEMINLNGGSKVVEKIIYILGWGFGVLARIQERAGGDNGQWLA
jgi:hypothetical protein